MAHTEVTNLWWFKIGSPPISNAVINHPVLLHTVLTAQDLAKEQVLISGALKLNVVAADILRLHLVLLCWDEYR